MASSTKEKKADKGTAAGKRPSKKTVQKVSRLLKAPASIMGPRLMLIASVTILCCLGLVMVYSSSSISGYVTEGFSNDPMYFFKRQAVFMVAGVIACVVCALLPVRFWCSLPVSLTFWAITVVMLVAVQFSGDSTLGASRSINLGFVSVQPAEFAKIAVLMVMVCLLNRRIEGAISDRLYYLEAAVVVLLTVLLIYKQPDLGTAIILFVGVLALLYLSNEWIGLVLAVFAVCVVYFIIVCIIQPYHLDRLLMAIDPWIDPQDKGYQSIQARLAFGSGGLFGTGLGLGRQKYFYLTYPYNDFIYAVVGEELGLVGAFVVLALFCLFVFAGLRISHFAPDCGSACLAGSLTTMLGFQAFVNMACVAGIGPVTGKALPFLSYGGSSVLASLIIVGLILSVSLRSKVDIRNERRRDDLLVMEGGRKKNQRPLAADGSHPQGALPASKRPRSIQPVGGGRSSKTSHSQRRPRTPGTQRRQEPSSGYGRQGMPGVSSQARPGSSRLRPGAASRRPGSGGQAFPEQRPRRDASSSRGRLSYTDVYKPRNSRGPKGN